MRAYTLVPDSVTKYDPLRLFEFFEEMEECVCFLDSERRFLAANSRIQDLTGYSPEELIGRTPEILHPDKKTYEEIGELYFGAEAEQRQRSYIVPCRRKDGTLVDVETFGILVRDESGKVVGSVTFNRDVTEQVRLQRALDKLMAIGSDQSIAGAEKLKRYLDLGRSFLKLPLGMISRVEGARCEVFQCRAEGRQFSPGMTLPLHQAYCSEVIVRDELLACHCVKESPLRNHPGYERLGLEAYVGMPLWAEERRFGTLHFSAFEPREPFTRSERQFMQLLARWAGAEITRQEAVAHVEEARREVVARLRRRDRHYHSLRQELDAASRFAALAQYSSGLAEQIVPPLESIRQAIAAGLEALRGDNRRTTDAGDRYFEKAQKQAVTVGESVRGLRSLLEGQGEMREPCDLVAAVWQACELAMNDSPLGDLEIQREGPARPLVLNANRVQVQQAVSNLLRNALDALQEVGKPRLSVVVTLECGIARVEISDNGPGFTGKNPREMLKPFTGARQDSLGVGLSVTQSLVEAHGGRIEIESPGRLGGASVSLLLPMVAEEIAA